MCSPMCRIPAQGCSGDAKIPHHTETAREESVFAWRDTVMPIKRTNGNACARQEPQMQKIPNKTSTRLTTSCIRQRVRSLFKAVMERCPNTQRLHEKKRCSLGVTPPCPQEGQTATPLPGKSLKFKRYQTKLARDTHVFEKEAYTN